jgi:hypothetical protein
MPRSEMTRGDLVALFAMKATAPPPEANKLLVRHLQCKESIRLAGNGDCVSASADDEEGEILAEIAEETSEAGSGDDVAA